MVEAGVSGKGAFTRAYGLLECLDFLKQLAAPRRIGGRHLRAHSGRKRRAVHLVNGLAAFVASLWISKYHW